MVKFTNSIIYEKWWTDAKTIQKSKIYQQSKDGRSRQKLESSQPTLSAWKGERNPLSVDWLEQMSDFYGVTTNYLLERLEQGISNQFTK